MPSSRDTFLQKNGFNCFLKFFSITTLKERRLRAFFASHGWRRRSLQPNQTSSNAAAALLDVAKAANSRPTSIILTQSQANQHEAGL
jgi:hypothetical protein